MTTELDDCDPGGDCCCYDCCGCEVDTDYLPEDPYGRYSDD